MESEARLRLPGPSARMGAWSQLGRLRCLSFARAHHLPSLADVQSSFSLCSGLRHREEACLWLCTITSTVRARVQAVACGRADLTTFVPCALRSTDGMMGGGYDDFRVDEMVARQAHRRVYHMRDGSVLLLPIPSPGPHRHFVLLSFNCRSLELGAAAAFQAFLQWDRAQYNRMGWQGGLEGLMGLAMGEGAPRSPRTLSPSLEADDDLSMCSIQPLR